jgi:hypothetical protein
MRMLSEIFPTRAKDNVNCQKGTQVESHDSYAALHEADPPPIIQADPAITYTFNDRQSGRPVTPNS